MNTNEPLLSDEFKKWIINDYFTPNIKAEVILDTLLTPYITDIVKKQCKISDKKDDKGDEDGELYFVTKEMSIAEVNPEDMSIKEQQEADKYGNRGTKIDYILADEKTVYLVELKTNSGSIITQQVERYIKNCCKKTFREVLGDKLIKIIMTLVNDKDNEKDSGSDLKEYNFTKHYSESDLKKFFYKFFSKYKHKVYEGNYAEQARNLMKEKNLHSTNKYIYTIGQILDYLYENGEKIHSIWDKEVKLIYITPNGEDVFPMVKRKKNEKNEDYDKRIEDREKLKKEWNVLYLKPDNTESVSLKNYILTLKTENNAYAELLINIINELY